MVTPPLARLKLGDGDGVGKFRAEIWNIVGVGVSDGVDVSVGIAVGGGVLVGTGVKVEVACAVAVERLSTSLAVATT